MRVKTWKVLDMGDVPEGSPLHPFSCYHCGYEAEMPMMGRPLAQLGGGGIVFDNDGPYALPMTVQCRKCRRIFTNEPATVE
jgi:hypothetical protein